MPRILLCASYPGTFRGYNSHLAALLGLEYLVLDRPLTELPRDIPRPKAQAIYTSDTMYIYKLGKTVPRASFRRRSSPSTMRKFSTNMSFPALTRRARC